MMNFPLTITHLLDRAARFFGRQEIVSRRADKSLHRTTYAELHGRAGRLAHALEKLGVKRGDRVATLAWNHARHLELYLGVPAMGAVLHTLNLRLHPTEIAYIARHAHDKVVVVDDANVYSRTQRLQRSAMYRLVGAPVTARPYGCRK
jgi:fatty-acyl-CoA synthase